jgi:signal transduction histidine kinase
MRCPRCEQQNPSQATFCLKCGTPLRESSERSAPSYGDIQRSLVEAREQRTATSEILRVISRSRNDVQRVFETILATAISLLRGYSGVVTRVVGTQIQLGTFSSLDEAGDTTVRAIFPHPLQSPGPFAEALRARAPINFADAAIDPRGPELIQASARARGFHSWVIVPMVRDDDAVGTISVTRREPGGFTDEEIALLQTFADHAVIAIDNVRVFQELEQKNEALTQAHAQVTDALDRQTATSEILRAISTSPTDLQPVFETIVRSAVRLCGASHGGVYRVDGELVHSVAHEGFTPEQLQAWRQSWPKPIGASTLVGLAISTRRLIRIADVETASESMNLAPAILSNLRARRSRSIVTVPMLRPDGVIGAISIARPDVDGFSDQDVELLKTFADQAVIAIENARLFRELEVANRELQAASQHKSEFLANMSHELRTPLNAVIGFSEVLAEGMFGELNDKQEEYARDIHASGQHLLSLINDILDLSKIEAGRMELELTEFHLPTAIGNALILVRERAGRRGLAVQARIDERLGRIQADERKIRQVVLNLLSNAIKFTPGGGRIEVEARPRENAVEIAVTDTGIGIAAEDQEAVFEEFRQVGRSDKRAEGTGLGLTLCRKFIELHGGKIWVNSTVGRGSTFTFTIPVRHGG